MNNMDVLKYIDSFLTPEEIAESNLRVSIIGEMIRARNEQGITQTKLGHLSGVKKPVIEKMEMGKSDPSVYTMLKLLAPLGLTLKITPLE